MVKFKELEHAYHLDSGPDTGAGIVPATITGCDMLDELERVF